MSKNKFLITGGCGFIGTATINRLINNKENEVLNIDKLTYAANIASLKELRLQENFKFVKLNISKFKGLQKVVSSFKPNIIIHLAAETHVDRSIAKPKEFIESNIIGTFNLLETSRKYYNHLNKKEKKNFLFLHVSTDEVFGDSENKLKPSKELDAYDPSSPYSATKASSNHLVKVWNKTFGLPIIITNCSNNYGPRQFNEKFIPSVIINALSGKKIRIYGNGHQSRDWIYVEDHVNALFKVLEKGKIGEIYNIGTQHKVENIKVAEMICEILNNFVKIKPKGIQNFNELITFVNDRPAHDIKYDLNTDKIYKKLSWEPTISFEEGLFETVKWYMRNKNWWTKFK